MLKIISLALPPLLRLLGFVMDWVIDKNEISRKRAEDTEGQEAQIQKQEEEIEKDKKLKEFRNGLNWFVGDYVLTQKQKEKRAKKQK